MKIIKKTLCACLLFLFSISSHASIFNFDGELFIYDDLGMPSGPSVASGYVDFDPVTGIGNGGVIEEFLPKTGGSTFSNIQITGIGGNLFDVSMTVDVLGSVFDTALVWEILDLGDGSLSVLTVDGNGDGIPGIPLGDESPFPGISMALNGTMSPVPLPAAIWLFLAGLLSLVGVSRKA